jgi:hypothetical protein
VSRPFDDVVLSNSIHQAHPSNNLITEIVSERRDRARVVEDVTARGASSEDRVRKANDNILASLTDEVNPAGYTG